MFSAPWTETESRFVSMCLSVSAPWTEISDADSLTLFNEQKMFITSDPWPVFRVALSLVLFSSLSHWTAQNVLSVKASLWTLTHLRYSQINSHPHSRGHEATVIRLTPSHMYTHTHKHVCKHKSLFPVLELKNLEPVLSLSLSLSLSGFELAYFSSKRISTPFLPPSFIYEASIRASSWLVALPGVFCYFFFVLSLWGWALTQRKTERCERQRVFSLLLMQIFPEHWGRPEAKTSVQVRTVSFVLRLFFISSETWTFSSFIF